MEVTSILDSIKKLLGIDQEDTSFDSELIIFINGALSTVQKFGVGPEGYKISDADNEWSEFLLTRTDLEEVKTNIYLRVRLIFDPPQNAFAVKAIQDQIAEGNFYIEMYRDKQVSTDNGGSIGG